MKNNKRQQFLFLGVLLLTSIIIVFYKFASIPKNISFDEVDFAKLALSLQNKPYTVYSPLATGHTTFYFYILLASLKLFGVNSVSLRLPSALFGVLNVIVIYVIFRKSFKNNFIAFLGAFIFSTLHWYFNFARFSFEATFLLYWELMSIYFLLLFCEEKKNEQKKYIYLIFCALFAGLAFHSYYPGRLFFVLPTVWISLKHGKKSAFLYLSIVGIIIAPLVLYNVTHPDLRISQISFLSDSTISLSEKINGLSSNIYKIILMPFLKGDMNGRHNFPGKAALNPILGLLFLIGIIKSLLHIKHFENITIVFLMYLIIACIPTLLTAPSDNPNMLRTFTMIPAVIFFITTAIQFAQEKILRYRYSHIIYTLLFSLLIISTLYELRTYFIFQSRVFNNSFEVTCDLQKVVIKPIVPKECRVQKNMF